MKKMNFLFILITLILIFGTTDVFALDINSYFITQQSNLSSGTIFNQDSSLYYYDQNGSGNKNASLRIDSLSNLTNYDYFVLTADVGSISSNITSNIDNSSINWNQTCSQYGQGGGNNPIQGSITYADGTQASIDLATINRLCQQWSISGTVGDSTLSIPIIDYRPVLQVIAVYQNGSALYCSASDNVFTCPIIKNTNISSVNFKYNVYGTGITTRINVQRNIYAYNDNTTAIINNNNQNTNTINNSIQDTKDTITSNTIDSNTNTDNLITIPNSNGKNTILDLLMIPINFITSIVNSFSNSCVSYNLGNLLGTDLILPCINLQNILGSGLYNIIDAIFAFGMIFAFIRSVKKFIQKALLLASDVSSEVSIF